MPSVYDIKPKFQGLLRPTTRRLAEKGVTANQVTVAALVLSLLTGAALLFANQYPAIFLLLPLVLFLRMALNAIDGMLAREHGMKSQLGAILNELCDVISDVAIYLPFALLPTVSPWLVVIFVMATIISEMTGLVGIQIGASRRYDGPMGKSDRAFVMGALALALGLGLQPDSWLNVFFAALLLLTGVTAVNRAHKALAEVNS